MAVNKDNVCVSTYISRKDCAVIERIAKKLKSTKSKVVGDILSKHIEAVALEAKNARALKAAAKKG